MAYVIFDLDGTVICSKHRQNTLPDGSLNLNHWLENNTWEKIMADKLLPLARIMKRMKDTGHHIIVCTARSPHDANNHFLYKHGLNHDAYLSRGKDDNRPDGQLKIDLLTEYFTGLGFDSVAAAKPIMFDDNLKVIDAMISIGVTCYDATIANRRLAA